MGNLRLVRRIGRGGMGTVYQAEHVSLGTAYAVKVLHPTFSKDATVAERFRREAVACSRLRHENVVFVTDFGIDDAVGIYIVMEHLEGHSLGEILRRKGRLPTWRVGRIGEQIADAMAAAHRLDIVHRDLKPDNVVVLADTERRDFVKVLDFGIAQLRGPNADEGGLTQVGSVVGTPVYMAPEQCDRKPGLVGPWSDVYALGVIFYEMLVGSAPFAHESIFTMISQKMLAVPDAVSVHRPELEGSRLEALVAAMLRREPDQRPASMGAVRALLADALQELRMAGLEDARPPEGPPSVLPPGPPDAGPTSFARRSSPSLQVTAVVQKIAAEHPDSATAALLGALPTAAGLRGEALALAVWGVLQQELLDAPLETARFAQCADHLLLLVQAVLESHAGPEASPAQDKVFRALRNLLALAERERRRRLVEVLAVLSTHPLFPRDAFEGDGVRRAWKALKTAMTTEISLWPAGERPGEPPSSPPDELSPPAEPPPSAEDAPPALPEEASLLEKLRQPVSLDAIRSVFEHEIHLFGKKGPRG